MSLRTFMSASAREFVDGPAGRIEVAIDEPSSPADERGSPADEPARAARGIALIAHPHPLYGGTLDNKVTQTLAKIFVELGYIALRPNFRGVGGTEGEHDHGIGETDDLVRVAEYARTRSGELSLVLAGFSFGAYVQTRVAKRLSVERMVLIGVPTGLVAAGRRYEIETVAADTIVIHGEVDETVLLANVLDWARPQELPIIVAPGCDHFFHRKLHLIRSIIRGQWHPAARS